MYSAEIKNNNSQACLHILIPQIWRAARLWFGESLRWWMYLMSHPSLPALPVSNVSFHTSRLPADWSLWSRCYRLFPALRLQTPTKPFGASHISALYLFLSSSSSRSLLYAPLFKSSQASASLCLLPLFSPFKSRQVGANSLAVFLSLFIRFLVFCVWLLSLYPSLAASLFPPNWVERRPWSTILKEGSQLWCIFTGKHTASWIWPTVDTLDRDCN